MINADGASFIVDENTLGFYGVVYLGTWPGQPSSPRCPKSDSWERCLRQAVIPVIEASRPYIICLLLNSSCLFLKFFSGTGYLTACFALMVGPEGRAVGVEHIPELVAMSIENIKKSAAAPQLNDGSLSIHVAGKY